MKQARATRTQTKTTPAPAPPPRRAASPVLRPSNPAPARTSAPVGAHASHMIAPPPLRLGGTDAGAATAPGTAATATGTASVPGTEATAPGAPVSAGMPSGTGSAAGAAGAGEPLPGGIRQTLESRLRVSLGGVRVHTDADAQHKTRSLSARAFTYGNHIFLGAGERADDLSVMAHETAHVVQQRAAPRVQLLSASACGGDSYEREADRAATAVVRGESFRVEQQTARPAVQRLGINDALDYFADAANAIPGFRMFTVVIGLNPINMRPVARNAANIMRAVVEFIPGGNLITRALDNYGIFDRVGNWVEEQLRTLGMVGGSFRQALMDFLDSLGWSDILSLGGIWERARRIFTAPVERLINFSRGLVTGIVRFIKDAILRPLARLAEGTRGYDLLKAVLGQDPITGDPVPRNAETLIGGFMRLIGQEEVWENIRRARAVERAWAWFQGALGGLMAFVGQLPSRFISALQQLELADLVVITEAFSKIGRVFGGFLSDFISWAGAQVLSLLEIIFDVVAPRAMPYLRRAASAFRAIIQNPIGFIGTLVRAGIQGFNQFRSRFMTHLRTSLVEWLTGTMSGAAIHIPQAFTLPEIIKFVLSVLGLTWQNIRQKLVRATSEGTVRAMETTFDIVSTLVREGPAAAWDKIQEAISNLREMVMGQVMNFVRERVVNTAITTLLTSLNPAGAFIQAILAIYNTVMFFVERLRQIGRVAAAFIDSISAIASGNTGTAAGRVEQTMAGMLTLVISFLARIARLGNVGQAVINIINRIRAPIDRALDRVVAWIVAQARRLGRFVAQAGVPQDPNERLRLAVQAAAVAARRMTGRVTASLLNPVLNGIKIRYGLQLLQPYEHAGTWWVRAIANPPTTQSLGVPSSTPPAGQPATPAASANVWPVAIGNNLRVPESHGIETVVRLTATEITYTVRGQGQSTNEVKREYAHFMRLWNSGRIRLTGHMSAAQRRSEYTRLYGADVADAIMRRDELANNFALMNKEQAHHIIPVGVLRAQGVLQLLVRSGWNFNQAINGIPLAEGFHGNHPNYSQYVSRKIDQWVQQHGTSNTAQFRTYVENVLLPHVRTHILTAKNQYATTGVNLDTYFANLP